MNEEKNADVKGHHVETMLAYVNDDQITGNLDYTEEAENEKHVRLGIISDSLEISKLKDEVDVEMMKKVKVEDSEERIECLKEVLELLQGYTMSMDRRKKNTKETEQKSLETKEERETVGEKDKPDLQNGMDKVEPGKSNAEYVKLNIIENSGNENNKKNMNGYLKMNAEKKEKETDTVKVDSGKKEEICKTENDNEIEGKEKTSTEEEDGKKENENKDEVEDENCTKEESGKSGKVECKTENSTENNEGKGTEQNETIAQSLSDIFVNCDKMKAEIEAEKKQVCFQLEPEDMGMENIKNEGGNFAVDISVGSIVNKLFVVDETGNEGERIDDAYIKFLLSQTHTAEYFEEMERKGHDKYVVETEDISDAENGNSKTDDEKKIIETVDNNGNVDVDRDNLNKGDTVIFTTDMKIEE